MEKNFLEYIMKKNPKRQIKQSLGLKKQSRQKAISYMWGGKVMIICLIAV